MRLFVSTSAFRADLLEDPAGLSGVARVEFSGRAGHYSDRELDRRIQALRQAGMVEMLVHNYFPVPAEPFVLNFATASRDVLARSLGLAARATALCARHQVPFYSVHPGYLMDSSGERKDDRFVFEEESLLGYEEGLERFVRNCLPLWELCREQGVGLAIENMFPRSRERNLSLNVTPRHLDELMARLPEGVGILLDLGHLNVAATLAGFDRDEALRRIVRDHKERIFELHLSANDGERDRHLPLEEGDWQLDALALLADCPGHAGRGLCVTIESMGLDPATLDRTSRLVQARLDALDTVQRTGPRPGAEP